jgi:hypothetical protein
MKTLPGPEHVWNAVGSIKEAMYPICPLVAMNEREPKRR